MAVAHDQLLGYQAEGGTGQADRQDVATAAQKPGSPMLPLLWFCASALVKQVSSCSGLRRWAGTERRGWAEMHRDEKPVASQVALGRSFKQLKLRWGC